MALPAPFDRLRLPVIGSPLFIVSGPELVIAQCKAGIVGSFPALNARPSGVLDEWLEAQRVRRRVTVEPAPFPTGQPFAPTRPLPRASTTH
jgi:nitronate monooxygenase